MKITHEYNLPADRYEYNDALHAQETAAALWEVYSLLRRYYKQADLTGMTAGQLINELWEQFHNVAGDALEAME